MWPRSNACTPYREENITAQTEGDMNLTDVKLSNVSKVLQFAFKSFLYSEEE